MNDTTRMLVETSDKILADLCTKEVVDAVERGETPARLWRAFEENGLMWATAAEADGGSDLPLRDAFALLRPIGRHAAPLPIAETLLLGMLTRAAALDLPSKAALAIAQDGHYPIAAERGGNLFITDVLVGVPWARVAENVAIIVKVGDELALATVSLAEATVRPGSNIAGEPRDDVVLSGDAGIERWRLLPASLEPRALAALGRTVLMAGAIESVLEMSVRYALERKQFGRAIAEFQAIQHQLAVLAGEAAAAVRASDGALHALGKPHELIDIAAAKARVGEAAGIASGIAHQVHGAMGFTYEHPLHQRTRRLWSWREEFGSEPEWNAVLGRSIAAAGADHIWELITQR